MSKVTKEEALKTLEKCKNWLSTSRSNNFFGDLKEYKLLEQYINQQPSISDEELEEALETLLQENYYEKLELMHKVDFTSEVETIKSKIAELERENQLLTKSHEDVTVKLAVVNENLDKIREVVEDWKQTYYISNKEYIKIKEVLDK